MSPEERGGWCSGPRGIHVSKCKPNGQILYGCDPLKSRIFMKNNLAEQILFVNLTLLVVYKFLVKVSKSVGLWGH
jgi:hypothetical protein